MDTPGDRITTNLRKGVLEYCVLALIQRGPWYGLDLAKKLGSLSLIASEGTVYPMLARLRDTGLVTTEWVEGPSGRQRRYYRLTEAGGAQLATFRTAWAAVRDTVDELLDEEAP